MKVLVVDDDLGSLLMAQAAVQALGHECRTAPDGARAWEAFRAYRPDVVVTDRAMPEMDGLELCRRIRTEQDGYTYVVLLTALDDPQEVLAGMTAGADDYLTKPLHPMALEARLLAGQRVSQLHAELARTRQDLARQARTDPLTGLRNRLLLADELEELQQVSTRYGRSYCVALCDVDQFKAYNDSYGHPAGDEALRTVAGTLEEQLRDVDLVYRYGGEEFLVLLPEQSLDGAFAALDRARAALVAARIEHRAAESPGVLSLSVGVSGSAPLHRPEPRELLALADAALYRAKSEGRNQVRCAGAALPAGRSAS